jgi:hypothetical protein
MESEEPQALGISEEQLFDGRVFAGYFSLDERSLNWLRISNQDSET